MRFSAGALGNAAAWVVLIALICFAFVLVVLLGPFGLILLGLGVLFVCTSISLRDDNPTWGVEVFKGMQSPEDRAARARDRRQSLASLTFYRWCGVVLLVTGIAGFVWQQWG